MFESLSERFEGIFSRLRSKGTLRESDVDEVLREIRLALLEADVNFVVVKAMLARIRERAVGERIHEALNPAQQVVKLVNEAMVEALGGESFHATLALDGVILTKLDGDARGGAALSVKEVVGKPIAFASTGEKVDDFDLFHPDRLASRILGMGDVLTLIEKAEQVYEKDQAEAAAAKLVEGRFTLEDFLDQLQQVRKMGPLQNLMGMMPGMPKELRNTEVDEGQLGKVEAIIRSMTPDERIDPTIIDGSRRTRISQGSGTQPSDVSQLIKQFRVMQKLMKRMPGLPGAKAGRGKKGKKGRKGGGRVTPPGGRVTPKQPFTLP